ncbi:MAG: 50S ribosomal protein L6 [Nanoarchaeota archaeon]|nr:50S ribosomal protein L6 [Nanoarchaeota archaeon]
MAKKIVEERIEIPETCQITFDNKKLFVKGEKGEVSRIMFNPSISIKVEANELIISSNNLSKKIKKIMNTFKAHIKNIIKGVGEGHVYKLRICSGHFPMSVAVKDNLFEVKNFIGEKVPRKVKLIDGVKVKIDGSEVLVESIDKEKAGQMAASIEQLTRRPGFDLRIFQDGIYIIEKDGKFIK